MTEAEWLTGTDLHPMFVFTAARFTRRKLCLLTVGCCRHHWHLFTRDEATQLITDAEQLVDGVGAEEAGLRLAEASYQTTLDLTIPWAQRALTEAARSCLLCRSGDDWGTAWQAMHQLCSVASPQHYSVQAERYSQSEWQVYMSIFRDIFGNPFRPVTFSPEWRTPTAVAIAQGMYESRDFSAAPILADALQDAGCDNDDILNHCRDEKAVHWRGCWCCDLVLDKS